LKKEKKKGRERRKENKPEINSEVTE